MAETMSHGLLKLLREPAFCQVATLMPDNSPQITQVWVDTDGDGASDGEELFGVMTDPLVWDDFTATGGNAATQETTETAQTVE